MTCYEIYYRVNWVSSKYISLGVLVSVHNINVTRTNGVNIQCVCDFVIHQIPCFSSHIKPQVVQHAFSPEQRDVNAVRTKFPFNFKRVSLRFTQLNRIVTETRQPSWPARQPPHIPSRSLPPSISPLPPSISSHLPSFPHHPQPPPSPRPSHPPTSPPLPLPPHPCATLQRSRLRWRPSHQRSRLRWRPSHQRSRLRWRPSHQRSRLRWRPSRQRSRLRWRPSHQRSRLRWRPSHQRSRLRWRPSHQRSRLRWRPSHQRSRLRWRPSHQRSRLRWRPSHQRSRLRWRPSHQRSRLRWRPSRQRSRLRWRPSRQRRLQTSWFCTCNELLKRNRHHLSPGQEYDRHKYMTVFQLGLFLRALRPARTGLRPARFIRALPEFKKKKKN